MEIKLEKFKYPEDFKKQRELFIECFPETIGTPIITEEHYRWKFKSFPGKKYEKSFEYIARLDDAIVGYYAAIPYEYLIKNKSFYVGMVCDVMTGIKARGKGVFTKLGIFSTDQFLKEGLAFSTGFPIRPEVIPGHKKAGWDFPFQIPLYGKFLKFNAFFKAKSTSYLTPFANFFILFYNSVLNLFIRSSNRIHTIRYNSSQITDIVGLKKFKIKWCEENKIALNKSIKFLKWRLGAPEKNYEIIVLNDKLNQSILGYSIVRTIEKEGVPCLGVLDFCLIKNSQKFSKYLLLEIEKSAKMQKAELILIMMMKHKAKEYQLKSAGFLKTPYNFSFIMKKFNNSLNTDFLKEEKNWNLMWIDSDDL